MLLSEPIDLEAWWPIFLAQRLSDLKKHCRRITLHGTDLANLITLSWDRTNTLCHLPIHLHHHPSHLALSSADLEALVKNGVGPLNEGAKRTARKIDQMFTERRLLNAHLFWFVENPKMLPKAWHLFHFDEKSTSETHSHWKHGSHLHLMNHLTHPRLPLKELLDRLDSNERPWLSGGLHIRFKR